MPAFVQPEHDAALQFRGRVVEMHDRPPGAADRLEGLVDQFGARLRQHLDRHIVRDQALLDDLADKRKIGLGSGRKPDLDLLEAELQQHVEHAALALRPHRLDQRLVAVAQIDAAPDRRLVDNPRRPFTVGQVDRWETDGIYELASTTSETPRCDPMRGREWAIATDSDRNAAGGLIPPAGHKSQRADGARTARRDDSDRKHEMTECFLRPQRGQNEQISVRQDAKIVSRSSSRTGFMG